MRLLGGILLSSTALLVSGCAPATPAVDIEAETAALRAAADAYHEAAESNDVDTFVGLNANDVLIIPPNEPKVQGTEGARGMVESFTSLPEFQIRFESPQVHVAASGDMGYTLSQATMSFQGPDGNKVEDRVRDFHVWRKDAEGRWKVAIDIWNSELPLPGAPQ